MVHDPEIVYDHLASGDPARVRELGLSLETAANGVDRAAGHVTAGLNGTRWAGGYGQIAFEAAGKTVFVNAAMASWRLDHASKVLVHLASGYQQIRSQAGHVIRYWRTSARHDAHTRGQVLSAFGLLILFYEGMLGRATISLRDIDQTLLDWLEDGVADDYWWYLRTGGSRGPRVPDSVLNSDDRGWTQQGLAYDAQTHSFLTTAYRTDVGDPESADDDYDDSHISVIDEQTGDLVNQVLLTGPGGAAGAAAPQHAGGVTVVGDRVYVVGGGKLYQYSMSDIRAARTNGSVQPTSAPVDVGPYTSYVTVDSKGQLWLGDWAHSKIKACNLDANGNPDLDGGHTYDTPDGTNGAAVLSDGRVVFSTGDGRDGAGSLDVYHPDGGDLSYDNSIRVGNLPEELAVVGGQLAIASESGASDYAPWDTDGRDRDKDKDYGDRDDGVNDTGGSEDTDPDDLWGQTHLNELPLEALDSTGGFYVEPLTLKQAARELYDASDGMSDAATTVAPMQVPARILGNVSAAPTLSSAADTYLHDTARLLRGVSRGADKIGKGLRESAADYDATDLGIVEKAAWLTYLLSH